MRGNLKSELAKNEDLMMQLRLLVRVLLLLGVGIAGGLATAELTADQQVQPPVAAVGETATVMVMLSYSGNDMTQVTVTPGFTPGIIANPDTKTAYLAPNGQQTISYPIRAENSGSYWISSLISYTDNGMVRRLSKESPFTATGGPSRQQEQPGSAPVSVLPESINVPAPLGNESITPGGLTVMPADITTEPGNGSIQRGNLSGGPST